MLKSASNETTAIEDAECYLVLDSDNTHFLPDENIVLSYYVSSEEIIENYSYSQNGFNVISITTEENNWHIAVELSCVPNSVECTFDITIELENGTGISASLFAINNEYGTFISSFSLDNALENYCEYAIRNDILTKEDTINLFLEKYKGTAEESVSVEIASTSIPVIADTMSAEEETIIYCGYLKWRDDNNINRPLRKVKVEIYNNETAIPTLLDTEHTDDNGYFEFNIPIETDTFFRVYAGDSNVMVKRTLVIDGEYIEHVDYCYESGVSYGKPAGVIATYHSTFTMDNDLGKAFQISQAALTARDYAWLMMGTMPDNVDILYPMNDSDKCHYLSSYEKIHITGIDVNGANKPDSYSSWDTIMHEYGHHIQYQIGVINSPHGTHSSNKNNADIRQDKDVGIRLAWAESWPTIFALVAQDYYKDVLGNIHTVGDSSYTAYNNVDYDIEKTTTRLGEACERSIMAVLWDLFDSDSTKDGGRDTISLGHEAFWEIITAGEPKIFSDFIADFYVSYPQYIDDIGANLSHYQMATTVPALDTSVTPSQTTPPKFIWSAQGGSSEYPNDRFELIVFDKRGNEVLRSEVLSTPNYTLTAEQWQQILYSYGTTYTVAVSATQSGAPKAGSTFPIGPETGVFISGYATFTKPPAAPLSSTITFETDTRLVEKTETLQPSQYAEYKITFPADGRKIVQTFGTSDTYITVYDSTGSVVASNDDSGYLKNAFVSYNFKKDQEYTIRVRMYFENESGSYKFSATPASMVKESSATAILAYDDIYSLSGTDDIEVSTTLYPYNTVVYVFTPSESGNYTFTIDSDYDTYIYVDDPRSTTSASRNDDSGEEYNPLLTKYLEAGIPYYIVCSAYDPGDSMQPIPITLQIYKNNS